MNWFWRWKREKTYQDYLYYGEWLISQLEKENAREREPLFQSWLDADTMFYADDTDVPWETYVDHGPSITVSRFRSSE